MSGGRSTTPPWPTARITLSHSSTKRWISCATRASYTLKRVLSPLLHAALDNTLAMGDAALTGPVSRGDANTVASHLDTLTEHARELCSRCIWPRPDGPCSAIAAGRITPSSAQSRCSTCSRTDRKRTSQKSSSGRFASTPSRGSARSLA